MEVSTVCRNFIDGANRQDWRTAVLNLNGLNMYEMLRSLKALDTADIAAVRQWRYSPLLLNGTPERFVLTVTVSFSLAT